MPVTSEPPAQPMTIGELSRRTQVTVKALRTYTDWGLIYTAGRSPANYRLYDTDALWCVRLIGELRSLGLTLAEIRDLLSTYADNGERALGPSLAERLRTARARIDSKIADLEKTRRRIDAFEATHQAELAHGSGPGLLADDPRRCTRCA
ncbi:MerR family transcriptional regulator [Streptomyces diastaticus]|jgi:DNA-binding transcriptional MerR regulator|uniref:MerR family transcriptional regulator n=1 Tax=Streptomyces griseiscabiei TaxID=2993540 RepID=A0ABU4LFW4_9ACTN|nr:MULTISPECIES: MerR family transcriptional regulator [Streptomyces]MDX2913913.1 MerR family transcriptional regulator [Streptomyces griseiscabiei]